MPFFFTILTYLSIATASGAPPDLTGIAAIITAAIGVFGFLYTVIRGRSPKVTEVEQATSYVRLVDRQDEEIETLRREKRELQELVSTLRSEVREVRAEVSTTKGELSELKGQIRSYLSPEQYADFSRHT